MEDTEFTEIGNLHIDGPIGESKTRKPKKIKNDSTQEVDEEEECTPMSNDVSKMTGSLSLPIAPRGHKWNAPYADKRVRDFVGAKDAPNSEYGKAFLVCYGDPTSFGSYKLPFADIVSGKLCTIYTGVAAAAGRLNQTDISDSLRNSAEEALEKLYKRCGTAFKDPEMIAPWLKKGTGKDPDHDGDDDTAVMSGELREDRYMEISEFDLSASPEQDGDFIIYPNSLLFETGDYPDKDFAMGDEDMAKAVREFQPGDAPVDYQHIPGPLDGKMGHVEDVRKEGGKLFGVVKIPKWLDAVLPAKKRVSCTWDKKAKKLVGLALVLNPRIEDAALMAAFSASQTDDNKTEGEVNMANTDGNAVRYEDSPMQKHHDMSVAMGAECPGCPAFSKEDTAARDEQVKFLTPVQLKAIQHVHDHAATFGASCNEFATRTKAGKSGAHVYSYYSKEGETVDQTVDQTKFEDEKNQAIAAAKAEFDGAKAEFETKLAEMGTVLNSLTAEIETTKHDAAITSAFSFLEDQVKEFKMTSAEKEQWEAKISADNAGLTAFEAVKDILAARPRASHAPTTPTQKIKSDTSAYSTNGDAKDIVSMADELSKEKNLPWATAFAQVRRENPDLVKEYAANRKVNSGS